MSKRFLVENTRKGTTIKVTLHNPPYEDENVLAKTGYKLKDCVITDLSSDASVDLSDYKSIENEYDEKENSLRGMKSPKKAKGKK